MGYLLITFTAKTVSFSDHKSVFFNVSVSVDHLPPKRTVCSQIITENTAIQFIEHFNCVSFENFNDVEGLTQSFNGHCSVVLDIVAPLIQVSDLVQ